MSYLTLMATDALTHSDVNRMIQSVGLALQDGSIEYKCPTILKSDAWLASLKIVAITTICYHIVKMLSFIFGCSDYSV